MTGFIRGVVATLVVEAAFILGINHGLSDPKPAESFARVEREMSFKVLAPPGMEGWSYVALDCKPKVSESAHRSGKKSPTPWKKKIAVVEDK